MYFEKIRSIIASQLEVAEDEIAMDTNLAKDLEADSLDAVEIIMSIEDEFGIEIPDDKSENLFTVGDIVSCVEELVNEE